MEYKRVRFPDGQPVHVVTFDVCSSSEMIEKLTLRHAVGRYVSLLSKVKHFLADAQKTLTFDPYKFTGDGWILLFDPNTPGPQLLKFMRELSELYRREVKAVVEQLDHPPAITGINFGADKGPIFHAKVFGSHEYVARPIIIACRLQGAIKAVDKEPAYKALVSREFFAAVEPAAGFEVTNEQAPLHGLAAGEPFQCKKIKLLCRSISDLL
jgi:hypothetical protein